MLGLRYFAKHLTPSLQQPDTADDRAKGPSSTSLEEPSPSTLPFTFASLPKPAPTSAPPPSGILSEDVQEPTSTAQTFEVVSHNTPGTEKTLPIALPPPRSDSTANLSNMIPPALLSPSHVGTLGGWRGPLSPARSRTRHDSLASSAASSGKLFSTKPTTGRAVGGNFKIGFVQDSAAALRKKCMAELGLGVCQSISGVSYVNFLEWIRSERLTTLPHEGSCWDRVLIRALYFAEQLHKFEQAISGFALDASSAAAIGYGHARLLLELGHKSSEALDKAFSVFYKFEESFSSVLHRSELVQATTPQIREQLCLLFTDLLSLVTDVSIRFYKIVHGLTANSGTLDIYETFGDSIDGFRARQNTLVEAIWQYQLENQDLDDDELVDIKTLSLWLSPQDRVIESLTRDSSAYRSNQAEFTCLWFQKHLADFMRSNKTSLLVTAQSGGGKTTLAGSIIERLQRPIHHRQYDTLFCSLSPDIPTTATSLAVAKSLLSQLLSLRVGNMRMYGTLVHAYQQCHASPDSKSYEDHLWKALAETLKQPLDGSNELVLVIDGIDEIAESQSASIEFADAVKPEVLLDRLTSITNTGKGVRLISFSSSATLPAHANGVHYEVSRIDVHDDLHAVALRALARNPHFLSQKGYDQEAILERLIQTAYGSFLWTIMACQILNAQKSPDAMGKALQTLSSRKPSVQDLISDVCNSLDMTGHSKTVLSWILAAERPLTTSELRTLSLIDTQQAMFTDKGANVAETMKPISPLLTLHDRIVRCKHPAVHSALHKLATQNKISIPLKDSEKDLLLRILTYVKLTLRDRTEPSLEELDPSMADRLFSQHTLLEYTVLYWVLHLQQSGLAPQSGDFKPTSELQKVFPDTALLPILEQICWDTRLPIPQALELHKISASVRRGVFSENHPSVLQTYLAIATCYSLMSRPQDCATYFYRCTSISREVLGVSHPLTIECANYYIKFTDSMTSPSRTEVMTHREDMLALLISAYEKQLGADSEIIIRTRELLAQLYASVHETDKAKAIYQKIQESTNQKYGHSTYQSQGMREHLGVSLGQRQGDRSLENYTESLFHGQEEQIQDALEVNDIASINSYMDVAKEYASHNQTTLAEHSYVELWMQVASKCRKTQSVEWHEKNIDIATAYSQFLKSQKRTSESSSILVTIWQQYEHHQLAYNEQIISRLVTVAKEMKSLGMYSTALSIFTFASSFYKNVQQQDSSIATEISNQVAETSSDMVNQSVSSSTTVTETTSTFTQSILQEGFFSMLEFSHKVDRNTLELAQKFASQHMETRDYASAIKVIRATLQHSWASLFSNSIQDVTLNSSFTKESITLLEKLAECYIQTKQMEKAEDTYNRFFRATLSTHNVDQTIFDKAKSLLLSFYDKHRYADKAISLLQDTLVAYRNKYGYNHDLTINALYDLGRRCQARPRSHPYWIEYYLQIISNLNKNNDISHKDALDAMIITSNTYWEDRRYAEAVTIYRSLWNTFVKQTKQHKIFNDTQFVQLLFEHYYQCLEETKASYESLFNVAKQYRDTCLSAFGAKSKITTEASLSLARISQESKEHASTAISLYEELSQSDMLNSTTTTTTEISQALSSLYSGQMESSSASNMKSESLSHAISMAEKRLNELVSRLGYSHESSLAQLRELSTLYHRQQKTEAAVKMLTKAAADVVSKEISAQKLIDSAASIAASFHAIGQVNTAHSLVQELHRQICARENRQKSQWSFDLTKASRVALAFLASMQYNLRKDMSVTYSEIMADLVMEYIYFARFRDTLQKNDSLAHILLAAAPLRSFLRRNNEQDMISVVDDQAVDLFTKRDTHTLNIVSKDAPRIFITGILDHLGNGVNTDFNRSVILSSNAGVEKLTKNKKFLEAYDIADMAFLYGSKHKIYSDPQSISMGFKLASLLAGRGGEKCPDANLRNKMLQLSNRIVHKILEICEQLNINFAQVQLYELSQLSVLLAEQQDWSTLEWLLTKLWNTRDAQRSWPPQILQSLGRRLICARFLAGHPVKAIRLCEDIAYNLRRAHGSRAPITIETYDLLAQLYTSTAQSYQVKASSEKTGPLAQEYFKKALEVPEDILRLIVHGDAANASVADEPDTAASLLANEGVSVGRLSNAGSDDSSLDEETLDRSAVAKKHLHLLKLAYQRLGSWPKPYGEYERLSEDLFREFGRSDDWKGEKGTGSWDAKKFGSGKAESPEGTFEGLGDWGLGDSGVIEKWGEGRMVSAFA